MKRIEELQELVADMDRILHMFDKREGRNRYLKYWRKKNGKSDLTYPDGDEVYKEFWELKDSFERIIERLGEKTEFLKDCTKYGNKNAKQQERSYSTMMMYEVADLVDDLIEIVKEESGGLR